MNVFNINFRKKNLFSIYDAEVTWDIFEKTLKRTIFPKILNCNGVLGGSRVNMNSVIKKNSFSNNQSRKGSPTRAHAPLCYNSI